jgi:hypothetical protein
MVLLDKEASAETLERYDFDLLELSEVQPK